MDNSLISYKFLNISGIGLHFAGHPVKAASYRKLLDIEAIEEEFI